MCRLKDYDMLDLSKYRRNEIRIELDEIHKQYLPLKKGDLSVLDIGADEGTTCLLYAAHGAKHIIAIEGDREAYERLVKNAKLISNKYHVKIDTINAMIGNIKCDIEGGEEDMVVEQHFIGNWKTLRNVVGIYNFPSRIRVIKLRRNKLYDDFAIRFSDKVRQIITEIKPRK